MDELLSRFPALTAAHLRLALSALALGLLFSLPTGVLLFRRPRGRGVVLGAVGVLQTIPSLALLAFMVPAIAAVAPLLEVTLGYRPSAIGAGPALAALTVYGVLPILQNTVTGLDGVDPAMVEAARGVGMTSWQRLTRVELPLSLPVIMAGLRTAAVWTIGTAVLATPIGASSLGDYIFIGLQTRNHASIALGCLGSALLAIGLDLWLRGLEQAVVRRARRTIWALGLGLVGLWLAVSLPVLANGGRSSHARIGAKAFTEGYIMAEVFSERLSSVGLTSTRIGSLGSSVVFDALRTGDIDLYLDFSGTIWVNVMKRQAGPSNGEEMLEAVRNWLREEYDIRIAAVLGYENRYAFGLKRAKAEQFGLERLSELAARAPDWSLVAGFEFYDRPEWVSAEAVYGLDFAEQTAMEQALAYEAVHADARDVVVAYSTDARVQSYDLVLLEDDLGAIPPYEALVLVRGDFADRHPEAIQALARLEGAFSEESVRALNRAVDEGGQTPRTVAREWVRGFNAQVE